MHPDLHLEPHSHPELQWLKPCALIGRLDHVTRQSLIGFLHVIGLKRPLVVTEMTRTKIQNLTRTELSQQNQAICAVWHFIYTRFI